MNKFIKSATRNIANIPLFCGVVTGSYATGCAIVLEFTNNLTAIVFGGMAIGFIILAIVSAAYDDFNDLNAL